MGEITPGVRDDRAAAIPIRALPRFQRFIGHFLPFGRKAPDIAAVRKDMATKEDIAKIRKDMATTADLAEMRADTAEQLNQLTWRFLGALVAIQGLFYVMLKLF